MKTFFSGFLVILAFSTLAFAVDPIEPLPAAVAQKHLPLMGVECDLETALPAESHDFGHGHHLYLVPCVSDKIQTSYRAYLMNDADHVVIPVMILSYNQIADVIVPTLELTSASVNDRTGIISSRFKADKKKDCGQSSLSKMEITLEGMVIHTIEVRAKNTCTAKSSAWPVVFQQK